jgi:hypothetical protein
MPKLQRSLPSENDRTYIHSIATVLFPFIQQNSIDKHIFFELHKNRKRKDERTVPKPLPSNNEFRTETGECPY